MDYKTGCEDWDMGATVLYVVMRTQVALEVKGLMLNVYHWFMWSTRPWLWKWVTSVPFQGIGCHFTKWYIVTSFSHLSNMAWLWGREPWMWKRITSSLLYQTKAKIGFRIIKLQNNSHDWRMAGKILLSSKLGQEQYCFGNPWEIFNLYSFAHSLASFSHLHHGRCGHHSL